jgi:hypothetical protein
MKNLLIVLTVVAAASAYGQSLAAFRPLRVPTPVAAAPADPAVIRQGGDTWEEAVPIPGLPYITSGTNEGYSENCCNQECPYDSVGPAVFYSFVPAQDVVVRIDLCGSDFDTGLYVFDESQHVVACNLDYYDGPPCGAYVSCIESVVLAAGELYYIVVVGQWGPTGIYQFAMTEWEDCIVDVPPAAVPEGEPTLVDDYDDAYNGGCNSPEFGSPFQELEGDAAGHLLFAGVSGWYHVQLQEARDTDWFLATIGPTGTLDLTLNAERDSYLFELAPQDCNDVAVAQSASAEGCVEATMQVTGAPGELVWLWVGPQTASPPDYPPGETEFDYLLEIDGLQPGAVAVHSATWSAVRSLYR